MINCSGAILLAQWIDPYGSASTSSINQQLDKIATQVAAKILERNLDGAESGCFDNLTMNAAVERVQKLDLHRDIVLETINTVLYTNLGFVPASEDEYYQSDNSLIDKVT